MASPTQSQVHVNAAMTRVSIAYRNANYIAGEIFPGIPVENQSDEYFVFSKADWFRNEAGPRAPGTRGPEVEYALSSSTYSCRPISATKVVPDEVVDNADSPLRPRIEAVEYATDKVLLYMEHNVASKVFATSTWSGSATPATTWDDDASDPLNDVETARETVVGSIGREPNVCVIGREVWSDLKNHPDLLERIKHTQTGIMTPELLAELFEVEKLLIGRAIYTTSQEGTTASYSFLWGKDCWFGWVPSAAGLMIPAAGYVFTWKNRTVEKFRRAEEKSDAYRAEVNFDAKVTSADAGYYMPDVVA